MTNLTSFSESALQDKFGVPALSRRAVAFLIACQIAVFVTGGVLYLKAWPHLAVGLALTLLCGWIVASDARRWLIPDLAILGILAVGFLDGWVAAEPRWAERLAGAVAAGGVLWGLGRLVASALSKPSLGFGDVKLAAACGFLLGGFLVPVFFLVATVLAFVHLALLHLSSMTAHAKARQQPDMLPFGIHLALSVQMIWLAQRAFLA